ncbi:MAG: hypothetical protein Q7K16_00555 [Candidatus Azambacteria bacterium]|nr:hypothetical protein [Candidatus Azambacteria bacterium]
MLIGIRQAYLLALIFSTILAWSSFFGIVFFTNPQSAGVFGVSILYISLVVGFLSLLLILWQLMKRKKN